MSITFEKWMEEDVEYAIQQEERIVNLGNTIIRNWDFQTERIVEEKRDISINIWGTNINADLNNRREFIDLQRTILNRMGAVENNEGVDLSPLKYQFEQDCWEYSVEGCSIDYAIKKLRNKYNNSLIANWAPDNCIPYYALYCGMQEYDSTNYKGLSIVGMRASSKAHIAENICARLFNNLAEKETQNIANKALTQASYSGFRMVTGQEIKSIEDIDADFMAHLGYCRNSMLKLLKITDERTFKRQYMECMKAMFCFGTIYKSWLNRYVRL